MHLFDIASRHMTWLAERQMATAANVANADTPGYRAREVNPFEAFLDGAPLQLSATSPMHLSLPGNEVRAAGTRPGGGWVSTHSGNDVSIEKELMAASSSTRMMNIDVSLTRSFHRMLIASMKA